LEEDVAWIYGVSRIGLDPSGPFPKGFALSGTWAPMSTNSDMFRAMRSPVGERPTTSRQVMSETSFPLDARAVRPID
jgi:hypothetical protein